MGTLTAHSQSIHFLQVFLFHICASCSRRNSFTGLNKDYSSPKILLAKDYNRSTDRNVGQLYLMGQPNTKRRTHVGKIPKQRHAQAMIHTLKPIAT